MNKKILILKDENKCHDLLKRGLEDENYDVIVFDDGEDILRVIGDYKPDLIVVNSLYRKMDESFVLKKIMDTPGLFLAPIMIISNPERSSDIEEALFVGFKSCILKGDFDTKEVIEKIKKYLNDSSGIEDKSNSMDAKGLEKTEDNKNGLRVLLVEDDEFLRDICKRKLDLEGFKVSVAVDGNEALKKINEEDPQVVLLDVILPGMDGFEILKNVRENPLKSKIAIIMLTNLGQESDIEKGLKLGADEYIVKAHFTVSEIIQKIKSVLKNRKSS